MWLLIGATDNKDYVRIALFTSEENAITFVNDCTSHMDGNTRFFYKDSPLYEYVWIKIEYESELPTDPIFK